MDSESTAKADPEAPAALADSVSTGGRGDQHAEGGGGDADTVPGGGEVQGGDVAHLVDPGAAAAAAAPSPSESGAVAVAGCGERDDSQRQISADAGADGGGTGDPEGSASAADSDSDDDDTDDDDETETTEESPCGRWLKRREEIKYRDVPGIDTAFLAMDAEEGVEVVWNEAQFTSAKKFKAQEERLKSVFDALTQIEHANIVHFHHYWLDPGSVAPPAAATSTPAAATAAVSEAASSTTAATATTTGTPPVATSTTVTTASAPSVSCSASSSATLPVSSTAPTASATPAVTASPSVGPTPATTTATASCQPPPTAAASGPTSNNPPSGQSSSVAPTAGGVGGAVEAIVCLPPNRHQKLPRLIFITEYMSSGSLKQFLRKTKKNNRKIQQDSWKRWCTQILYALSYLHQRSDPAIVHGNLTCDTIFIQHNGLVKIGSIAPDVIHQSVRSNRDNMKNLHYLAPEWHDDGQSPGTPSDIYSFGIAALETAALDIQSVAQQPERRPETPSGSGSTTEAGDDRGGATSCASSGTENPPISTGTISEEQIEAAIEHLESDLQKDFIRQCLRRCPRDRPTAVELLFHPAIFEFHSLKLLSAHVLVDASGNIPDPTTTDEAIQAHYGHRNVMACVTKNGEKKEYKLKDLAPAEKLEKFVEDVRFGIYPITNFGLSSKTRPKNRSLTPGGVGGVGGSSSSPLSAPSALQKKTSLDEKDVPGAYAEHRKIIQALSSVGPSATRPGTLELVIVIRFNEGKNRVLTAPYQGSLDTPDRVVDELIKFNFVGASCRAFLMGLLADTCRKISVTSAEFISEMMASGKTVEQLVVEYSDPAVSSERLRQLSSREMMVRDNVFMEMMFYATENPENPDASAAKNPTKAKDMRDPFNITSQFPLPEGAHFCPPMPEQGSMPYKEMAPGTNAFDYSLIEEQLKKLHEAERLQQQQQAKILQQQQLAATSTAAAAPPAPAPGGGQAGAVAASASASSSSAPPPAGQDQASNAAGEGAATAAAAATATATAFTPMQSDAPYDSYAYLQGAQKVLEGLSLQQQQQSLMLQQPKSFTPSVTPVGYNNQQPAADLAPTTAPECPQPTAEERRGDN